MNEDRPKETFKEYLERIKKEKSKPTEETKEAYLKEVRKKTWSESSERKI